jgi:hypothetical protein
MAYGTTVLRSVGPPSSIFGGLFEKAVCSGSGGCGAGGGEATSTVAAPPYVPKVLPSVGPMDSPYMEYSRMPSSVGCVAPWIFYFVPCLDASSLQFDVISSMKILSCGAGGGSATSAVAAAGGGTPSLLIPQPSTVNPELSTLNPQPSTLNPQDSTLNPQFSILNPQSSTLNPNPQTLKPKA